MQQADLRGRKRATSQAIVLPATTKWSVPASVQLRNKISFDNRIDDLDEESDRSNSESDKENETSIPTSVLDAMKEKVEYILDGDRFICRRAKRKDIEDMGESWTAGAGTDVSNVKADLSYRIAAHVRIVEIEPTDTHNPKIKEDMRQN
ncbi:hypothetical protein BGX38DRAFT_1272837 [Terfezia claveryi]|nr:hypothetical protein BGX38DRAFT_1272837 [Terfezia claveryi]